jgi:hypothetical protein
MGGIMNANDVTRLLQTTIRDGFLELNGVDPVVRN